MAEVSAQLVKELRDRTNVGMMACKKALEEANGNMDEAIELLRKRGEAKAGDKADRSTGEGIIALSGNALVKINCETDFVARNEDFVAFVQSIADKAAAEGKEAAEAEFEAHKTDKMQAIGENLVLGGIEMLDGAVVGGYVHSNGKLAALVATESGDEAKAKDVAMHVVAMDPLVAFPTEVPAELIEKEREIAREQLVAEGKPEQIMDKIIEGKINKFCAERALTKQAFVKDPSMTVEDYLGADKLTAFIRMAV